MTTRLLHYCFASLAMAATAYSQDTPGNVVQTPAVVVTEISLPSDSTAISRVGRHPEIEPSADPWSFLNDAVANLHVAESGSGGYGALFSMRGLSNTPYFSEPAVTVYFADIPLPSSFTYPTGLFGFNSASVYRGPGGVEFGRATDGGVIVFSPDNPGSSSGGELVAQYGNHDARGLAASALSSASGAADVEVNAEYDARNGYITNNQLGVRVDDQENENQFARLRLRPGPGGEFTLEILDTRSRDGAQPLVPLGGPLFVVNRPKEGVTDLDGWGAALKAALTLPNSGTFTAVTSYSDWRMNPYTSLLVLPPALENEVIQDQKSWNEELHLKSEPLARIRVEMGAWFSKGTTDNYVNRAILNLYPIEVSAFEQENQSAALFGEAVLAPVQSVRIAAGLRAESDEKQFARDEQAPTPGLDYVGTGRYAALLPKLAANWTPTEGSHAEASVALGLRPGGFASYTDNPALIPFASERSTACSVGWDTSFARRSADIVVRAFYDRITNLQIERSFSATDYMVAAAPRAHSEGGEMEGRWRPSGSWSLEAGAGYTWVRLDTFFDPLTGANESGNEAPNAPRFNANLRATYRPGRGWFATGTISALGRTNYDERESAKYSQSPYALIGLRAGYETSRWTCTFYGENLAGKGYYELIVPGVNSGNPGAPRTVGAKVTLKL